MAALSSVPPSLFDRFSTMAIGSTALAVMGALAAASPQKSMPRQSVATDGKKHRAPLAKPFKGGATDDPPEISQDEAVALHLADFGEDAAGGWMTFRNFAKGYAVDARRNGWPEISDKKLSQIIRDNHGCITRTTNKRDKQGRRLSIVIFPEVAA